MISKTIGYNGVLTIFRHTHIPRCCVGCSKGKSGGAACNASIQSVAKAYSAFLIRIFLSCRIYLFNIRRPRPTQGGARQGIRHFPPTIWKLATATATATAAAAVLFCAMVFSRPGPTFLQQPAAGAAGRQQQSSQQSRSR